MRKIKAILACVLTLAVLGTASMTAFAEEEVTTEVLEGGDGIFISDIEWESWHMFESNSTDATPKYKPSLDMQENEALIKIAGITYLKGFRYHVDWGEVKNDATAAGSGSAEVVIDISSYGCTRFYAVVGKDSVGSVNGSIQFQVIGDGEVLADSDVLGSKDDYVFDVDITGVQKLTLKALDGGDGIVDDSCAWANAQIYKTAPSVPKGAAEELEDGLYLTDLDWKSWSMFESKSTDASPKYSPTVNTEENGGPIVIGGVHYAKGVRYHPDQPGDDGQGIADITYDLSAYNYTRFDAVVGKDSVGAAGDPTTKIKFQVIGDGKVLAESPELTNAEAYGFTKVKIEGVKELTLRALSVDDVRDDSCAWGNVQLSKTGEGGHPGPSTDSSNTTSDNDASTDASDNTSKADGDKEGGISPIVIVVIVVVVVAVVAVVVFVVLKKKKAAK